MLEMKKLAIFPQSYVIKLNRFKCKLLKYNKSKQNKRNKSYSEYLYSLPTFLVS